MPKFRDFGAIQKTARHELTLVTSDRIDTFLIHPVAPRLPRSWIAATDIDEGATGARIREYRPKVQPCRGPVVGAHPTEPLQVDPGAAAELAATSMANGSPKRGHPIVPWRVMTGALGQSCSLERPDRWPDRWPGL